MMLRISMSIAAIAIGLGTTAASAQDVDVRVHRDHGWHRGWAHERGWERHHWRDRDYTGSIGCKTVIIHREGMTKRIRRCG